MAKNNNTGRDPGRTVQRD